MNMSDNDLRLWRKTVSRLDPHHEGLIKAETIICFLDKIDELKRELAASRDSQLSAVPSAWTDELVLKFALDRFGWKADADLELFKRENNIKGADSPAVPSEGEINEAAKEWFDRTKDDAFTQPARCYRDFGIGVKWVIQKINERGIAG